MAGESCKLGGEEHDAIYRQKIASRYLSRSRFQDNPVAVITGGQPGSMKSRVVKMAETRFRDTGYVLIDADKLRPYHPDYLRLLRENDKTAANLTHADCGPWATQLMRDAATGRRNLIIDQTSRNPVAMEEMTRALREAGYRVELHVMAISHAISEQRIHQRYEDQKERDGFGRFSTKEKHEEAYAGVSETIASVEAGRQVHRLCLYNARLDLIYDNQMEQGRWKHEQTAQQTLNGERDRPMTRDEARQYVKGYARLVEQLNNRNAPEAEIAAMKARHEHAETLLKARENTSMEQIKRQQFNEPDRMEVQEEVARVVEADPEKFIERFRALPQSLGGRYVCSDTFKETFEQYRESKESRNRYNTPVHNAAAVLASEQFRRVLKEPHEPGRDVVTLLTGIPGAGKTSSVLDGGRLSSVTHAIYEGQLANPGAAIAKVQEVLDAGFQPVIVVVHPMPEKALDNTLQRFGEMGRGASLNTMAKIQGELPAGFAAVRDRFGDRVQLEVVDRRDFFNPVKSRGWEQLHILESEGNHEQIKQRLEQHLDARRSELSSDAWRQAAGLPPVSGDRGRQGHGLVGGQHEKTVEGREAAQGSRPDAGVVQPDPTRTPARTTEPVSETDQRMLDALAVNAALPHLAARQGGLEALRAAGAGQPLDAAQRKTLLEGWNGPLLGAADHLTRLGELAYVAHTRQQAAAQRQSPDLSASERQAWAQKWQPTPEQQQQRALQARNIALREEEREQRKHEHREQKHEQAREARPEPPRQPKRDRGGPQR